MLLLKIYRVAMDDEGNFTSLYDGNNNKITIEYKDYEIEDAEYKNLIIKYGPIPIINRAVDIDYKIDSLISLMDVCFNKLNIEFGTE